ncbi:quinone oxidoreductase family protein [Dyella japonica]|uniref:NADPH2:quinone reductase n=1 Tax=Dyella japonica TaxID=231455 RepID=A0ABV2JP16_9GAMM
MKAAVYYENGGPEVFRFEEIPTPVCQHNEVLIEVLAASIEGGDLVNREIRPLARTPHTAGYQCAGTIVEVGAGVTDRSTGQRVVAILPWGSHAQFAVAPAKDTWVLPAGMDVDQASAIPIAWGTAHECLFEFGQLQAGQSVLIHAASGALGLAAVQLAKRAGARVLATASSAAKLERLLPYGVDVGIDYTREDFVAAARAATEEKGVHLVIDSVGGENLARSIQALRYRGRVISVGVSGRDESRPDPVSLWRGNNSMQGVYFPSSLNLEHDRVHTMVQSLIEQVARGELQVVIDKVFPLSEAADAHRYVLERKALGRVLLRP